MITLTILTQEKEVNAIPIGHKSPVIGILTNGAKKGDILLQLTLFDNTVISIDFPDIDLSHPSHIKEDISPDTEIWILLKRVEKKRGGYFFTSSVDEMMTIQDFNFTEFR